MDQPKTPKMPPGREQLPTVENVARRLQGSQLIGNAVVISEGVDGYVDLTLAIKVGGRESPLGTLVCPLCDYPLLIGLLAVGTVMMRVDFHYEIIEADNVPRRPAGNGKKQ
jgi:hypothetical protein